MSEEREKIRAPTLSLPPQVTELCPHCGHLEAYSEEKQLRSADEGSTILYTVSLAGFPASKRVNKPDFAVREMQIRMESQQLVVRYLGHTGTRVCVPVECEIRKVGSSVTGGHLGGMQSYYADECRGPDTSQSAETGEVLLYIYSGSTEHGYRSESAKHACEHGYCGFLGRAFRQTV